MTMTREQAMACVLKHLPTDRLIIGANGHISRALFAQEDRAGCFYMIGSMGLAPSIALGIAEVKPEQKLAVFDGDGNVLMNLGSLATVAVRAPKHFLHFCFDNGQYGSTGGQRTISPQVSLSAMAKTAGYVWAQDATDVDAIAAAMPEMLKQEGPSFLLMKVAAGGLPEGTGRVTHTPEAMTARTRSVLTA